MKTVLITGISRGIGRALAETFLEHGDYVIGTSQTARKEIEQPTLSVFELDLREPKSIGVCVRAIDRLGKKIDIHINNAGVLLDEGETKVVPEKLRATLEVNLIGTIDFTERILPLVKRGGHIINISSAAGSLGMSLTHDHYPYHYPSYKISKTALNMYTRTLAGRLRSEHITVSSVHPGWVKTEMGGAEAPVSPQQAAKSIFELATANVETGQFWYQGKKIPW